MLPERGFEYVAKQECPKYFADMFRPSGVCGSGHKQIRGERVAEIMAKIADMALAAEIMADGSRNYGRWLPPLEALSRAAICYEGSPLELKAQSLQH